MRVSADEENDQPDRSSKPGCLLYFMLIGIAALGGGIYLMGRWDTLGGSAKGGAVVLIVLGTLALLPPLFFLGFTVLMKVLLGKVTKELSGAAQQMIDANKSMYGEIHEFRPAEEDDFDGLDLNYYDGTKQLLAESGFRHLGDIVDETIEESNDLTTPIRSMTSPDGTTQIGLYHFKIPSLPEKFAGQEMLMCDVSTEFSDGTFLLTSNSQGADQMTPPPRIVRRQHPLSTTPLELIAAHETEKQKLLAAKPGVTAVAMSTLEDVIASEKRQQEIKNSFRKDIGYVDPEEVRRISNNLVDGSAISDQIAEAADQARKREQP
jgi:hypothetical protein